jgi:hypothetical protein
MGIVGSIAHLAYHLGAIRQINTDARGPKAGTFRAHGADSLSPRSGRGAPIGHRHLVEHHDQQLRRLDERPEPRAAAIGGTGDEKP